MQVQAMNEFGTIMMSITTHQFLQHLFEKICQKI